MRWRITTSLAAGLLLSAGICIFRCQQRRPEPLLEAASNAAHTSIELSSAPSGPAILAAEESMGTLTRPTNHLTALIRSGESYPPLPREEIDRWLRVNKTNASSLLAAALLAGDPSLYLSALTNFPNDPRVLFSVTASNRLPEIRRELLDRFKKAAPDNALSDYLSAADHLKNGEPDQALADLLTASRKTQFDDYTLEDIQNREDLLLRANKSPAEAKIVAHSGTLLPHLSEMRTLAQDMAELQKNYLAIGDVSSAERLAQIGLHKSRFNQ